MTEKIKIDEIPSKGQLSASDGLVLSSMEQVSFADLLVAVKEEMKEFGRNLLRNSGTERSSSAYYFGAYPLAEKPVVGETYTCTIWGELGDGKTNWKLYNSTSMCSLNAYPKKIADGVYQASFKWKDDGTAANTQLIIYNDPNEDSSTTTIRKIKLERGSIGTHWTPAPEDIIGGG